MKESILSGWGLGIERMEGADPAKGPTWKLDLVDGTVGATGQPIPGTGSGEVIHVLFGDEAAAFLLRQLREGGAGGVVPAPAGALGDLNRAQRRRAGRNGGH